MASKKKRGRPSSYKPEYTEQARKLCLLGAVDEDLADFFNVASSTISNWKHSEPDFLKAITLGKDEADNQVERSLFRRAMGFSHPETKFATHEGKITDREDFTRHYPPDTAACIFWLKNRKKDHWRDKQDLNVAGDITLQIVKFSDDKKGD